MDQQVDIHVEEMQPNSSISGITNIYKHKAPPEGHPNGIYCPNCDAWTWRTARECVECPFDLWLYFDEVEKEKRKKILKRRSNYIYAVTLIFLISAYISFNYFSVNVGALLFFCAFIGLLFGTQLEQAIKQIN
ncbi:sulfite exporter TauE/SafE family protein [Acinetobacter baumannii]|uniref:hypothetical protein n=1 Tax=Acinetobacter baumannii TaxID=470 RepID=UPI003892725A